MNNDKLAILVPSRGRPLTFMRFVEAWAETRTCSDLILRNGEADPVKDAYKVFENMPHLTRVVGPDTGFKSSWHGTAGYNPAQQDLWKRFPDYSAYLCMEDDTVLHTPGFDRWLLDTLSEFPGRIGIIELYDRSQTIHCLCFSREWCQALGYLSHEDLAENGFQQTLVLANMEPVMIRGAKGNAEFTHYPHLASYGYTGNERAGAMAHPEVVKAFREAEAKMYREWMPLHADAEKYKLIRASEGL